MTSPTPIDYHPFPVIPTVTIQSSTDHLLITIGPSLRRILSSLGTSAILAIFGVALFALLAWSSTTGRGAPGGFSWWISVFPLIFIALAFANAAFATAPLFFPILFEVTPDRFVHRWRKLTEAQSLNWPRNAVLGFRVGKARIGNHLVKTRGLIIHHQELGDMLVLRGSNKELETIARLLSSAMGLPSSVPVAMTIPKPPRCRFRRVRWRGGVHIFVPPSWEKTIAVILILPCALVGWFPMHYVALLADESGEASGPSYARVILGTIIAGILWFALINGLRKARKKVAIIANAAGIRIVETGFTSPIDTAWHHEQIAAIEAISNGHRLGKGHLQLSFHQGIPLITLAGEKMVELQWLVSVVKTIIPANASPSPRSATPSSHHP